MRKIDISPQEAAKRKQLIERGKSLLIVVLSITALLLAGNLGLLGSFFNRSQGSTGELSVSYSAASAPFAMLVTPAEGSHYAALYDAEALVGCYDKFSSRLAEALGSAGAPEAVDEEQWQAALRGQGVYFDFLSAQPLVALSQWLGTDMSGEAATHSARRLCLAVGEGGVSLYYIRAYNGEAYRCGTAVSETSLIEQLAEYLPNGARFHFEMERSFAGVDDYMVLTEGQPELPEYTVRSPLGDSVSDEELLSAFSMSSYVANPYSETDGTRVYVQSDTSLRIESSGRIVYNGVEAEQSSGAMSQSAAIEYARRVCAAAMGSSASEADFYLSYIFYDRETEQYTIRFEYSLAGLPVAFADGRSAASLVVQNGLVISAELTLREYTRGAGLLRPLPSEQAAALVRASGGGEPVLCYLDDMAALRAEWVIH